MKFWFWLGLLPVDVALMVGWAVLTVAFPLVGFLLLPVFLFLAIVPDIIAYVAIHLRYDTTWYVMSDRSLRTRRGIWVICETTITYENVQNVSVSQGPVQRYFGIADVVIETAGGGGGSSHYGKGSHGNLFGNMHQGRIQGIADAHAVRDRIMSHLRSTRSAGLGDAPTSSAPAWSPQHIAVLRQIRDEAIALSR
jgi:membrane protein YdbS with pleckstrin-like domain